MGSSAPAPPDPYKVSDAQTTQNIATARANAQLNAQNLYSPFGSTTWNYDPNDPRNVGQKELVPTGQTLNFSPEVLDFVNKQLGLSNNLADKTQAQLANLPTGTFDPSSIGDTSSISKTMFSRQLGLLQPSFDDAQDKLAASLSNRGIPIGSDIWNKEMNRYQQAHDQTLTGLSQDADLAAGNEYQRLLSNALQLRELPFQELNSLEGATPAVQQPGFATQVPSSISNTDVAGNVWNAYNASVNASNASNSGAAGMLGAVGSVFGGLKSSKNFKEDFHAVSGEQVLSKMDKLPIKDYRYKDLVQALSDVPERRTGPMAEDWAKQFGGDGVTIDRDSINGNMMAAIQALNERTKDLKPKSSDKPKDSSNDNEQPKSKGLMFFRPNAG
jgi:hypothetical protein